MSNSRTPTTLAASNVNPILIDGSPFSIFCKVLLAMLARSANSVSDKRRFFRDSLISCPSNLAACSVLVVYGLVVVIEIFVECG